MQRCSANWRPQLTEVLRVESAQRAFDGGTQTSYSLLDAPAEKGDPDSRTDRQFRASHSGRTSRMRGEVQLSPFPGCVSINVSGSHASLNTADRNLDRRFSPERRDRTKPDPDRGPRPDVDRRIRRFSLPATLGMRGATNVQRPAAIGAPLSRCLFLKFSSTNSREPA